MPRPREGKNMGSSSETEPEVPPAQEVADNVIPVDFERGVRKRLGEAVEAPEGDEQVTAWANTVRNMSPSREWRNIVVGLSGFGVGLGSLGKVADALSRNSKGEALAWGLMGVVGGLTSGVIFKGAVKERRERDWEKIKPKDHPVEQKETRESDEA